MKNSIVILDVSEDFKKEYKSIVNLFDIVEEKYKTISIVDSISKDKLNELDRAIKDCENTYFELNSEFIGLPQKSKDKYSIELDRFKVKINNYRNKFNDLLSNHESKYNDDNPRNSLLNVNKNMNTGINLMSNSIKVMRNTNNRDNQTMNQLNSQTNTIIETKNNLNNMEALVIRSETIVKGLLRRVQANKLILILIIMLLFLSIVLILYYKVKRVVS